MVLCGNQPAWCRCSRTQASMASTRRFSGPAKTQARSVRVVCGGHLLLVDEYTSSPDLAAQRVKTQRGDGATRRCHVAAARGFGGLAVCTRSGGGRPPPREHGATAASGTAAGENVRGTSASAIGHTSGVDIARFLRRTGSRHRGGESRPDELPIYVLVMNNFAEVCDPALEHDGAGRRHRDRWP